MSNVPDFDDEYFGTIEEDVMRALQRKGFFGALDDLFDPLEALTPAVICHGDYRHAREIASECGYSDDDMEDILGVLKRRGGCCDCEILYNAVETSRLKAKYWRARANDIEDSLPHGSNRE